MKIEKYGIILSKLKEEEIELIRQWRNNPKISQYMQYRNYITEDMQKEWFKSINNDRNYFFIIEYEHEKIGLTEIKNIDREKKTGEGGIFIYDDKYLNSILPYKASLSLLECAFYDLKLNSVFAKILKTNKRAIRYNASFGFALLPGQDDIENQLYILNEEKFKEKSKEIKKALKI